MKKNVALLTGGYSGESVVSIKSAEVVEKNLDTNLFNTYKIIITKDSWFYTENSQTYEINKTDFSLTIENKKILFDVAFIIIHGTPGEDGKLQGYLEMLRIPYTTCDSVVSGLTFNKAFCNGFIANTNKVNVSQSECIFLDQTYDTSAIAGKIGFPCFVKPNAGGSSIGMSKVNSFEDLQSAIDRAFKEDKQVLIEHFIKGRELTCGLIKINKEKIIFPITEIISKKEFFDFEAKYTTGMSDEITPAQVSDAIKDNIQSLASTLYDKLNCFGMVRFDFILENDTQKIYFLEVNTIPGQSENSIVPQQIRAMGKTIKEVYTLLINEAINRQ